MFELRAAAEIARAAKLPELTLPRLAMAVADWIRDAANGVIGVPAAGPWVLDELKFMFLGFGSRSGIAARFQFTTTNQESSDSNLTRFLRPVQLFPNPHVLKPTSFGAKRR